MLKKLLKLLGWVPKVEREGLEINYENAWELKSIDKKNKFMSWLIEYVPENSIWSIEGIYDKELYEVLEKYYTDDGRSINKGTVWPRQRYLKVVLSKESKEEIKSKITNWDFDIEFTHQHVYYQDNVLLTSYDNLHEGCSWISKSIDSNELENLEALGIIKIEKSTEPIA